jgi:predicted RNase H-like HicB family nuclease
MKPSPGSAVAREVASLPFAQQRERHMRWVWYWAILDRESDGFVASIPDLGNLAAYGANQKAAVAHVAERAAEHVRALEEGGQPVPHARQASEMPSTLQAKIGRAMISVPVGRAVAKPGSPASAVD